MRLHALFDTEPLEQACAGYYRDTGRGAPPTHSVPRLVRALLLAAYLTLSLRELEERLRYDWVARWFCGYGLHEETPDHSNGQTHRSAPTPGASATLFPRPQATKKALAPAKNPFHPRTDVPR